MGDDEPAKEAPSSGEKKASKVRDIEALRARIAQAQAQTSSGAKKEVNAWESMKSGMSKAVKSGGKVEGVQKAMAETGASIKSMFAGLKLGEKLKGLNDCWGMMNRLENWKKHSPMILGAIVLIVFLVVGATFMLKPAHVGEVSVDVDLDAAAAEQVAATTQGETDVGTLSSLEPMDTFAVPAPSFAWGSSTPFPAPTPTSRRIDSSPSKKEKSVKEKKEEVEKEEEEAKKKLSPKERRAAAREALLMDKVEQHVQDYRNKLVEKLHDKKADPLELLKTGSDYRKGGRKEKVGK